MSDPDLSPEATALRAAHNHQDGTPASVGTVRGMATRAWQAYYDSLRAQEERYKKRFTDAFGAVERRLRSGETERR